MHRIRTWARRKAHGPAPLIKDARRTNSQTSGGNAGRRSGLAGGGGDDGTPGTGGGGFTLDPSPAALGGGIPSSSQDNLGEKPNVATRFLTTAKDILFSSYLNILLVFVPVGIAVHFVHLQGSIVFAMNAIAIVPLAGLLSHATESVARRMGDTVGALMNVTFGNAVELIIFIIALVKNEIRIVQASLLGSILVNLLLILGMCFFLGGLRYREQMYNSTVTQMSACLLSLSVVSLLLPTAFHASFSNVDAADDKVLQVSRGTSVILLLVYGLYILFQLNSHAYMYQSTPQHIIDQETVPGPAANYFNSSSSSDSSSSSSSSDSDSSGHSRSTARRFKRAVRRARNRKHSVASQEDANAEKQALEQIRASNAVDGAGTATASSGEGADVVQPLASEMDDAATADDEGGEHRGRRYRKKHRKHHHHKRHKNRRDDPAADAEATKENDPSQPAVATATTVQPAVDPRRVDFAVGPELESQSSAQSKPFSLRNLRPALPKAVSQTVFSHPPPAPNTTGASTGANVAATANQGGPRSTQDHRSHGLRRTSSLPTAHQLYRIQPGAIPPINPIIVDGTPRAHSVGPGGAAGDGVDDDDEPHPGEISRTTAVILLLVSTGLVALCAEFMVDAINEVVEGGSGISEAFIGLILLPIVGNAAEHTTAVTVAMKNKMDLAIGVALGSSIQIAIFITPLVVILGWIMGKEMSLYFTLFETVSMFVSAFIVNFLVLDGRSNYLEGALLCSAYVIIAVAAFFYPNAEAANLLGGGNSDSSSPSHGGNSTATATVATATAALAVVTATHGAAVVGREVLNRAAGFLVGR